MADLADTALGSVGEAVAFGLGFALGRVLDPIGTGLKQEAWSQPGAQILAVDVDTAAQIVAENVAQLPWGEGEAAKQGISSDNFDLIVNEVLNAPGFAELIRMLRRGTITTDQLAHGFRKARLETEWDAALTDLQDERIDPSVVATAIQRGLIPDPGYLPVDVDYSGSNVRAPDVSTLGAEDEAAASGITPPRLALLTRLVGLPPGPGELMQLLNRGTINDAAFVMGIAEGNTRNEWAAALKTLARRLLTPTEYQEAALRGVLTNAQANAGAALSGMTDADATTLFELLGRPLNVHELTTGLARGGSYGGDYSDVPEPYQDAIRRSSIRPEYASLAYANRYTYPSAFVLRSLAQAGELGDAGAIAKVLEEIGWEPGFAATVAASWAPAGAGGDPNVVKAQTQLWTTTHTSYVNHWITDTDATAALKTAGIASSATGQVLAVWQAERALIHAGLTAAQIKKAVGSPDHDAAWATGRLQELGWDTDDAATFLAE